MKTTPTMEALQTRKRDIDRELFLRDTGEGWKRQPDASGWWLWRECGRLRTELLLLAGNGKIVADDDSYAQASGIEAEEDGHSYNYWEGTDTTQRDMPGIWFFLQPA